MGNLLGTLISQSLCGHKNPLFIGSVSDARVPSGKLNVYSCPKCMKVFTSEKKLLKQQSVASITFSKSGIIIFSILTQDDMEDIRIVEFMNRILNGSLSFDRFQLKELMLDMEKNTIVRQNEIEQREKLFAESLKDIQQLEQLLKEEKASSNFLQSVIDNKDTIIEDPEVIRIGIENEKQLHNSNLLSEWLKTLLNEGEVLVSEQAYKLFHLMLSTLYGYEPMRYRWEWEKKEIEGNKYYSFFNRKTRRTK